MSPTLAEEAFAIYPPPLTLLACWRAPVAKITTRYPDPVITALDTLFEKYWLKLSCVERLATGCRWSEGPIYFGDGRYLLWSDIPYNRILKWEEETGAVSIYRRPSNFANGHTRDRQGRLVSCEHGDAAIPTSTVRLISLRNVPTRQGGFSNSVFSPRGRSSSKFE